MGSCSIPSRIFKGKMTPGQMGLEQVTVQNLDVVKVDPELNMIVVRGAIPGPKGGIVYIKNTVFKKGDAGSAEPAEGFRSYEPAEGFRQECAEKGEFNYA